ncbi:MAG: ATP-grasp domain-containing protein [Christensenellales bacterium]|jgi:RimK family alpha-L-glutamate ligase
MLALIYENAYYSSASSLHQRASIINALVGKGIDYLVFNSLTDFLSQKTKADFCIFCDKDYYAACAIEQSGIKVYNSPQAILAADSKIASYLACRGIADMPASVLSPLRYSYAPPEEGFFSLIEQKLGYPLVLKADKSSLGKDVYMVSSRSELIQLDRQYFEKRYILQQFIGESVGRSIRAVVIGGEVICFLKYANALDFRSNKERGGVCSAHTPPAHFYAAARKIAEACGLFYCGVDFFDSENPMLIEINGNAYFKGVEECYGFNPAHILVQKILDDIKTSPFSKICNP